MGRIKTVTPVTTFQQGEWTNKLYYKEHAIQLNAVNESFRIIEDSICHEPTNTVTLDSPLYLRPSKPQQIQKIDGFKIRTNKRYIDTSRIEVLTFISEIGERPSMRNYVYDNIKTPEKREEIKQLIRTLMKAGYFLSNSLRSMRSDYLKLSDESFFRFYPKQRGILSWEKQKYGRRRR
jgi:hypothetical protein